MKKLSFAFLMFVLCSVRTPHCNAATPSTQPAESWSTSPPDKWPQLVLTNQASFDGHSDLEGASSFLMKMPDASIVVGTAKHLTKEAGGVTPPIALPDLDHVLQKWEVFPRTKPEQAIAAKKLAETANHESTHDWLLLQLVDANAKLPSAPLTPRLKPVEIGETVYLIGVPYTDKKSAQNVFKGVVTARPLKNYFTYEFTPPVHISGFSGAPIVDSNGLLVGHGVSRSKLKQQGELEVEFGGEDASLAVSLWKHRDDPPAVDPNTLVHLDLPDGWVAKTSKTAKPLKFAEIPSLGAYAEVFVYAKADIDDDLDLKGWATQVRSFAAKNTKLENLEATEVAEIKVGDHPALEFDVTGALGNVNLHYRYVMLEVNGGFCKWILWSTPSHWDDALPKFDEFMAKLK